MTIDAKWDVKHQFKQTIKVRFNNAINILELRFHQP